MHPNCSCFQACEGKETGALAIAAAEAVSAQSIFSFREIPQPGNSHAPYTCSQDVATHTHANKSGAAAQEPVVFLQYLTACLYLFCFAAALHDLLLVPKLGACVNQPDPLQTAQATATAVAEASARVEVQGSGQACASASATARCDVGAMSAGCASWPLNPDLTV